MSTIFDVPCPDCGRPMVVESTGNMQCQTCRHDYRARMGHLFAVAEPPRTRPGGTSTRAAALPDPVRP
jgi:uncharacterized Zn finger protein (UPF0148 family)